MFGDEAVTGLEGGFEGHGYGGVVTSYMGVASAFPFYPKR